jgi:hypothetical protein
MRRSWSGRRRAGHREQRVASQRRPPCCPGRMCVFRKAGRGRFFSDRGQAGAASPSGNIACRVHAHALESAPLGNVGSPHGELLFSWRSANRIGDIKEQALRRVEGGDIEAPRRRRRWVSPAPPRCRWWDFGSLNTRNRRALGASRQIAGKKGARQGKRRDFMRSASRAKLLRFIGAKLLVHANSAEGARSALEFDRAGHVARRAGLASARESAGASEPQGRGFRASRRGVNLGGDCGGSQGAAPSLARRWFSSRARGGGAQARGDQRCSTARGRSP